MNLEDQFAREDRAEITRLQKKYGKGPFLAADAVIESSDSHFLLIKRGSAPQKGRLAVPGGKLEEGETFFQACLRELREETGLKAVKRGKILDIDFEACLHGHMLCDEPERDPRGRWISMAFYFKLPFNTGQLHVEAADDAMDVEWIKKGQFKRLADDQFFADHLAICRYFAE